VILELRVGVAKELEAEVAQGETICDDPVDVAEEIVHAALVGEVIALVEVFSHEAKSDEVGNEVLVLSDDSVGLLVLGHRVPDEGRGDHNSTLLHEVCLMSFLMVVCQVFGIFVLFGEQKNEVFIGSFDRVKIELHFVDQD
jgi:hypothetical protein